MRTALALGLDREKPASLLDWGLAACLPSDTLTASIQRDKFNPCRLQRLLDCLQGRGPWLSGLRLKILNGTQTDLGCRSEFTLRDVEEAPSRAALTRGYVRLLIDFMYLT